MNCIIGRVLSLIKISTHWAYFFWVRAFVPCQDGVVPPHVSPSLAGSRPESRFHCRSSFYINILLLYCEGRLDSLAFLGQLLLDAQVEAVVLLFPESSQFLLGRVHRYVTDHVFLGPPPSSGHLLVIFDLNMVQHALRLQISQLPS